MIAQVQLDVRDDDTAASLAERLLPLEHRLLIASIDAIALGRVALGENGVTFDGAPLRRPLRLDDDGALRV